MMEFHISRQSRDRYQFDDALFSQSGNVIFTNFHAARLFAQKMNAQRDLVNFPERAIRAGQINAMGLVDEILHLAIEQYRQQRNTHVMREALDWLYGMLGNEVVDQMLLRFAQEFPPVAAYRGKQSLEDYFEGESGGVPNRQIILEELLTLWLENANPAFAPYQELFDDSGLVKDTVYPRFPVLLRAFFDTQPVFGPDNQNLIDFLRAPALAFPHSLTGQLEFMRQRWSTLLGKYLYRLLSSLDLVKEEEKAIFLGPGPARVYDFTGQEIEPERFSPDKDWMPSLVLLAKNAYVWLDQISKKYQQHIHRLDQIPEEELDALARWGFSGLWLIGLWERSQASKRIKQLRGNPDAVASAYSLFDYQIASDLGGEEAYQSLHKRAWQRGLRLASDMVPNHMGIDSRWVVEHPDWFISLDYSPFPSYTFNGPNLSWDERVGIYIEDHYFDNTDAAVVFKRVDFWNGNTKYIYHGNDGTSMPWNDTAQLNYLMPEVREAVIQTILQVARKFPVIRFDAAMTLAKKHFQRLWYPEPGSGGAIPSRAEHGLTREQFDAAIPVEFWREVVDRVAQEVPDTLLLAEAFWLMEGYFVRTLGMHRVYNSAFMNMLRDEKNAEYRLVMKNTLEFDPEILKRYVNFMNNPDERTAVDQFGKGDKYFGICLMMATLPGLPMFGHGQIEGFTEKYGMEYRRAYWDEHPDPYLVERHEREIFPLLRKRYLFAEVRDFLLYDFFTTDGSVNEDVFAYSNRSGHERSLVIYHNKFATARGWIHKSSAYSVKSSDGERALTQRILGEGLGLENAESVFCIFRDQISGLEYIRNDRETFEKGLYIELEAYKYHVFVDFRQVQDNEWHQYANLARYLNGRGVPSIDEALKEIFLQPVHGPFRELVNAGFFRWVITNRLQAGKATPEVLGEHQPEAILEEAEDKAARLLSEIVQLTQGSGDAAGIAASMKQTLGVIIQLPILADRFPLPRSRKYRQAIQYLGNSPYPVDTLSPDGGDLSKEKTLDFASGAAILWGTLLAWAFTHRLGMAVSEPEAQEISRSWIDEWLLNKIIAGALMDLGLDERAAWRAIHIIKLLTTHRLTSALVESKTAGKPLQFFMQSLLADHQAQNFLGVNRYQDVLWFNQEAFDELTWWLFTTATIELCSQEKEPGTVAKEINDCYDIVRRLLRAAQESGYQLERLLEAV
ncbi:MAG: alpha-amylase [Anaerolineales bacterium]|nr:alpha-amylase [Anaerolineales bacterium]